MELRMAGEYSDEQKDFADRISKGFNGGKPKEPKTEDEKPNAMKRRMMALSAPKEE